MWGRLLDPKRPGAFACDNAMKMQAKHKKFLALCMGENLERRRHETVVTWMSAMDNFDKAEVSDDDDDLPPRAGRGSASSSTLPNMDAGSASSSPGKSPGQDIAPIQNPFLLLQRKIRNKSQSLNSIRRSQSYVLAWLIHSLSMSRRRLSACQGFTVCICDRVNQDGLGFN